MSQSILRKPPAPLSRASVIEYMARNRWCRWAEELMMLRAGAVPYRLQPVVDGIMDGLAAGRNYMQEGNVFAYVARSDRMCWNGIKV